MENGLKNPCQTLTRDRKAAKRCQTLRTRMTGKIRKRRRNVDTSTEKPQAVSNVDTSTEKPQAVSNVDTDMETTKQVSNIDTDTEGMILKADPVDTADRNHICFLPFFLSAVGVY